MCAFDTFIYGNGLSLTPVTVSTSSLSLGIKLIRFLLGKQHFAFIPENLVWMLERSLTGQKMMQKFWWLRVIMQQNFNTGSAQGQRVNGLLVEWNPVFRYSLSVILFTLFFSGACRKSPPSQTQLSQHARIHVLCLYWGLVYYICVWCCFESWYVCYYFIIVFILLSTTLSH